MYGFQKEILLWHRLQGHLGFARVQHLMRQHPMNQLTMLS